MAVLAGLPLLVFLVKIGWPAWDPFHVEGDMALIELATRHASEGRQLLGPYSRFGFHHPGPAMFYLLAPLYAASGGLFVSLLFTALLANAVLLGGAAWTAWRAGREEALLPALVVLPLLALYIRPSYLCSVWNPNLAIVPFLAALLALAAVIAGRMAFLPLAVGAGSLALQCHLGFLLPLAAAGGLSAAARLIGPVRRWLGLDDRSAGRWGAWAALATGLAVVMWAPTVVEQLTGSPGNVTRIVEFLRRPSEPHGLGGSIRAVAGASGALLLAPSGARLGGPSTAVESAVAQVLGFALVAALPLALMVARRERRPFTTALAALGIVVVPAAVIVVRAISGDLHEYLLRWLAAVGALGLIAVAAAAAPALARLAARRRAARLVVGALVLGAALALATLNTRRVVEVVPLSRQAEGAVYRRVATAVEACRTGIAERGIREVELRIDHPDAWGLAAGLVLHLGKSGVRVSVAPDLVRIYGPNHAPRAPGAVLVVEPPGRAASGGEVVFADERVALVLVSLSSRR